MSLRVNWFIPVRHRDFNRMAASMWIRCLQLIPYLEEKGIRCTVNDPGEDIDINVFVRWQDRRAFELARDRHSRGQKVIFDLVVNYFDPAEVSGLGKVVTPRHRAEVLRMLSVADGVTCASRNIAERAREFHPTVEYMPDSIDARHFSLRKNLQDFSRPRLRAIWSGVSVKARELEPILPLLAERDIELVVLSDRRQRLRLPGRLWRRGYPHRFMRWDYERFPSQILEGDICLVHRAVDNTYDRGHSLFKIGVFLAQGVPAIASPVPSYREVLADGKAGLLCHSEREWEEGLDKVLQDRETLAKWSGEAQSAMQPYLASSVVEQYVRWFESVRRSSPN